jgi:LTXXQ motif family protein
MNKPFATMVLALALSAIVSPSIAEDNDQAGLSMGMMGGGCAMMGMMGGGMMAGGMMSQGTMWGRHAGMGAMVDGRLAYLKDELKIADTQVEAWNGYAEAVKGRVNVMQGMRESMMGAMQKGGAVERMDARIGGMEAMLEALKAAKPATETLYSVLTADQKKVADQLIGVDCGAM